MADLISLKNLLQFLPKLLILGKWAVKNEIVLVALKTSGNLNKNFIHYCELQHLYFEQWWI
jgi:hypothetical protein